MTIEPCKFEQEVAEGVRSNSLTGELQAHTESCIYCRETLAIVAMLRRVSVAAEGETIVPHSYRVLWIKAQISRKQRHFSQLDRIALLGAFVVVFVSVIGIALWKWHVIQQWIMNSSGEPVSNLPLYILAGCVALVWFLTEEIMMGET